jgi:flagellin
MSLVLNTNVSSLQAQDNLDTSLASQQKAIERLSSGLQINSAADDAAGLAIATGMTSQINGNNQAVNNANDGISLAQTAGSALTNITNDLQTIRQLAVESSNGTNSATDRSALNTEAQSLLQEINRQASSASFNGVSLLNGSSTSFTFQVGANTTANDTISISSLQNCTLAGLGSVYASASAGTGPTGSTPPVNGTTAGVYATQAAGTISINGVSLGAIAGVTAASDSAADNATALSQYNTNIADAVNAIASETGVSATINTTTNAVDLTSTSSQGIVFAGSASGNAQSVLGLGAAVTAPTNTTGLTSLDLSTQTGAQTAILQVDSALAQINTAQAQLGAVQNRFTSVVSDLQSTAENLTSARSGIQDTNYAAETANLTQADILQQSGIAVLSQANTNQKNVLSLLQNL